jgi:hypothetical protein
MNKFSTQIWFWSLGVLAIVIGLFLRFWHITNNQFLFYDEGMYLGHNRNFLNLVEANPPRSINELFIILGIMFKVALGTAKALWFFLLNLRVFIVGAKAWYFARVVSAVAGILTIALTYVLAWRYFRSRTIAFLSIIFLSLLPSHVFYSTLGMQESLSALLFLSALYVYLFYKSKRSAVVVAILLVCLFSTNYRMIISPIFIVAIEFFEAFRKKEAISWARLGICVISFAAIVFIVGSLYNGINRYVTFGWMSHQAQETKEDNGSFLLNLFSYPYYVFALEGLLFALIFWANIYLAIKKQWPRLLPFILVLIQMAGFSLAAEKGARYLCVVLPLMAIAAAVSVDYFWNLNKQRVYLIGFIVLACLMMSIESSQIVNAQNDYAQAVYLVSAHDPKAGIVSTQALVEQLYVDNDHMIQECPKNLADFMELYKQGYQYLILDPQAYISWTKDTHRFSPPLIDFIQTIEDHVQPVAILNHLNPLLLKRFVLDHNKNLVQSIRFLSEAGEKGYGKIRIYHIGQALMLLKQQALSTQSNKI